MQSLARKIQVPSGVALCGETLGQAGGRVFLVGGAVRDALLERPVKDYDLEVFGLSPEAILSALTKVARVEPAGDSFPVFKVAGLPGILGQVDVALPRRDSRKGPGHRGIEARPDPNMSIEDAARRRDITIKPIYYHKATRAN